MSARLACIGVALVTGLAVAAAGCTERKASFADSKRELWFAGQKVADIAEATRKPTNGGLYVQRTTTLVASPSDSVRLEANLDDHGFVTAARYIRTGPSGRRMVDVRPVVGPGSDGAMEIFTAVGGSSILLPKRPVIAMDLVHRVKPPSLPMDVVFVDVASADHLLGKLDARGVPVDESGVPLVDAMGFFGAFVDVPVGTAPPVFAGPSTSPPLAWPKSPANSAPTSPAKSAGTTLTLQLDGLAGLGPALQLDGPGQRGALADAIPVVVLDATIQDTRPPAAHDFHHAPFIESRSGPVAAFAKQHGEGKAPLDAARAIVEAVHGKVDAAKGGGPPSAMVMIDEGGDCDSAVALVVAAMRALGHAARPVVGWRIVDGALVPHAWAEVWTTEGWVAADATLPGVGRFADHVRLFDGLGSALTMGRVLGRAAPRVVEGS